MPSFKRTSSTSTSATDQKASAVEEKDAEVLRQPQLVSVQEEVEIDDVFGAQGGKETVNYRTASWPSTSILMIKSQIGLGILSVPYSFQTLGLAPGIICTLCLWTMTMWSGWYMGEFKLKHPQVYSLSDAGRLMAGRFGEEFVGVMYWLCCIPSTSSALVAMSTALNAMSMHGACTAIFVAVSAIAIYPAASLRTLENIRYITWVGLIGIGSALLLLMISVCVQRPSLAPQTGPLDLDIQMWGKPTFAAAFNAISTLFFAWTANVGFIPYASEMRNPRDFRKAILVSQPTILAVFLTIGIVVYMKAGQYVASPSLGTAGVLIKRIAYGLALPGLYFTGTIYIHLPAKWMMVRILRNSHHLNHSTPKHWVTWLGCTFFCLVIAYLISQAVPVFSGLTGLIAALVSAPVCLHMPALMYLYDNRSFFKTRSDRTPLAWAGVVLNIVLLLMASLLLVAGTYGSCVDIANSYRNGVSKPFNCADNSGSV
ncbi:hypothetical protein JCM6882_004357 [Rhodosporidiobolus microsporus]